MVAATLPLPHTDSTAAEPTVNFSEARFAFRQLETWLTADETNGGSEAQIEEQLQQRGRDLLRSLLQAHLRQRGSGDVGPALQVFSPPAPATTPDNAGVQRGSGAAGPALQLFSPSAPAITPDNAGVQAGGRADEPADEIDEAATPVEVITPDDAEVRTGGVRHGEKRHHDRTSNTVFGEVRIARTAYAAAGQASVHPLDEQLQLPKRSFSYPLQERLVRHAVQGPFDEAINDVERDTGVRLSKRSAEQVTQEAASDFQSFYKQRQVTDASRFGPIVVTGIDCKGVPMIRPEETLRKVRRGKGDKKQKKRMATVATVRTQQVRVRTPEEVVESLFRTTPKEKPPRKHKGSPVAEEHKRVWANLIQSKDEVIAEVVQEVKRVDPSGSKTHVALCDGERALQKRILPALQGVAPATVLVLDLLHALEKLWKVAHCLHPEGSEEATAWVKKQTLRVLKGKVSQAIKGMRCSATKQGLSGKKRETVDKVAKYLRRNRGYMRYDEYMRDGLPIASGCVEGACKNLIKDRMERSGMRWSLEGGEAMIRLRSLYLSGDLDEYWDFHLAEESRRLYPTRRWEVVVK